MSTHTTKATSEAAIVHTLGSALASVAPTGDAITYRTVARLVATAAKYQGSLTLSTTFATLDAMCGHYGVVWTLSDDGTFTVQF